MIKNKNKEYRERSKSRKRQQESYAAATRAGATYASSGATGATTQSPDITPLTAEETKLIVTTIMSAVVYAQYMEALEPGSYQKNIDEMYKLNRLPPVRFPPPRMTEAVTKVCRELFQQQVREQEEECSREQMSTATERDRMSDNAFAEEDISDETIANQAMEIDRMIKRVTVYIKKSSKLDIVSKNPNVRNEIRKAILRNEAKFTWKNPKAERENILGGFNRGRFDLNEIEYRRVEDHVYEKITSTCTGIYGQQHTKGK